MDISPNAPVDDLASKENHPKKKQFHLVQILLFLATVVSVLLLITTTWLLRKNRMLKDIVTESTASQENVVFETITPTPSPEPADFIFNQIHPYLLPIVGWNEVPVSEQTLAKDGLVVYHSRNMASITLPGKEWTRLDEVNGNTQENDLSRVSPPLEEYENQGWMRDAEIDDYRLVPQFADGFMGGVDGYVRAKDGKAQLILIEHNPINVTYTESDQPGPPSPNYPYQVKYTTFISDPVDIEFIKTEFDRLADQED